LFLLVNIFLMRSITMDQQGLEEHPPEESRILAIDRQRLIQQQLAAQGTVLVTDLSRRHGVTEETIRRDLAKLEKDGLLIRAYGGAYVKEGMHRELPLEVREHSLVQEKTAIAHLAAQLVSDGDTVFLDASTTALHVAMALKRKNNIIVVTNALKIAAALGEWGSIKVICLGGTVRSTSLTTVGMMTERNLAGFFADTAFICCDGIHPANGVTDASEQEAEVRKSMIEHAKRCVLVADHTKFGRSSFSLIAALTRFDSVISDSPVSEEWERFFSERNIPFQWPGSAASGPAPSEKTGVDES
jgi:DeoR/GlpR family transcriptional regulator of sugar metabolism